MSLTDQQRKLIHDLALGARALLTREARELLEGTYGLYPDGRMDPPEKLPRVQGDPEVAETYRQLKAFIDDEVMAGLGREEAVEKLIKETAFTHLNRLVAFKMMEARKLIRGTLDKGTESNAFKFYLVDPENTAGHALYQEGEIDDAYRLFLLWQSGQVAREIKVLFDPDNLPSRLFPRPRVLNSLLTMLNNPDLAPAWQSDETIGWVYQYFNEEEKAQVFDRLYKQKQKIRRQDIPAATQLFTPNWIVRFLVQNTLGRTWVAMHPDTHLVGTELLDYLVPLKGETPAEPLRRIREVTLLDPACGTMHFGLVAFDLFAAMYREELERAGEPGWPEGPSVSEESEIPAAIIKHNLFGIDIDLRAVQLSALTLYLKAKSLNKQAKITDSNLVCADVLPLNGARLGTFLREARFTRPVYERLIRALWQKLQDANELGSLLRLEKELGDLITAERARYHEMPLFAGIPGEFEREAVEEEFWQIISAQIIQGLDEFTRQQAKEGVDQSFFTGEAVKGLRLLDLMLRQYDVVVTNPPYSTNFDDRVADYLRRNYKDAKSDLYAAFIQRCAELTGEGGRLGMITQQSFMFISSYETLRENLRERFAIETMAHTGPRAFAEISGEKVNTTAFTLRVEANAPRREGNVGTYVRLVDAPEGEGKNQAFEQALKDGSNTYCVAQRRLNAIPKAPWIYWMDNRVRMQFEEQPPFSDVANPTGGMTTGDNDRFLRYWWEVGTSRIGRKFSDRQTARASGMRWFPYMKGGAAIPWYGNQDHVVNWARDGKEIRSFTKPDGRPASYPRSMDYYFQEGLTWSDVSSVGFAARHSPGGFIFDASGLSAFPVVQERSSALFSLLAILNSGIVEYMLGLINPTIHFQTGDLARLPIPKTVRQVTIDKVKGAIAFAFALAQDIETSWDFVYPSCSTSAEKLAGIEALIEKDINKAYGIDGVIFPKHQVVPSAISGDSRPDIRLISYSIGIIFNRFQPGTPNALGNAIYHPSQFAFGSLPEPSPKEFDELVGPSEHFAYIDADGGRHVFSPEVERALRNLTLPDGIALLDESHPRDLPALVKRALELMLGAEQAQEVIATGANGDLRKFLERDYFVNYHVKQDWYRKRPVYWPLQSAKRNYGFVLFHEKIDDQTFYTLQRDYLDHKLNSLRLHIEDLRGQAANLSGSALKRVERKIDKTAQLLEEIGDFARTIERVVQEGYQPKPNWIDDGVILRMAPLWELIPIWKSEPKKYWERLQKGDYDWSHIAMNYWPERVREACKTNKSFAIAHGHEEWYEDE